VAHYVGRFGSRIRLGAFRAEPVAFALLSNRSRGHSSPCYTKAILRRQSWRLATTRGAGLLISTWALTF